VFWFGHQWFNVENSLKPWYEVNENCFIFIHIWQRYVWCFRDHTYVKKSDCTFCTYPNPWTGTGLQWLCLCRFSRNCEIPKILPTFLDKACFLSFCAKTKILWEYVGYTFSPFHFIFFKFLCNFLPFWIWQQPTQHLSIFANGLESNCRKMCHCLPFSHSQVS
jgi:hypothetical protein